ncbi:hypothetical protein [Rahnella bonaserana]|jgi:hypothetical protein|uniref:Peptidase C58 YopT-type domain-containing protein n=1 Tax=Rahnella bonaserana TaxID=2816248 RepID=A0ABS6M0Z4_9GAMM|nr:hypothetical protein [Rahnella bonaserana]MBU9857543.1 hypothetical protein [Rahnella bonaserana]MCL9643320.1 hypothetical protein [Rahnella victoriana]WHZ40092.1 hypothetical protein QNM34_19055 [Rahnella bonaserana]
MINIISIEKNYASFLAEQQAKGCCFGFCLTWLGDIIKERPLQHSGRWLSGWFSSVPSADKKALLPAKAARQRLLFERAMRKQKNYVRRYEENHLDSFDALTYDEVTVNYKNARQQAKEKITGIPGLHYSLSERSDFMSFKGMESYRDKKTISGVVILFRFTKGEGKAAFHAVAAFRHSEFEAFFLDPNFGLFKTVSKYPMLEITQFLSGKYRNVLPLSEITISRRLQIA